MRIDGEVITECPMSFFVKGIIETDEGSYDIKNMFNDAMDAHSINDAGHLPEQGAWGDQTQFFGVCTTKVRSALNKYERDMLERRKPKK